MILTKSSTTWLTKFITYGQPNLITLSNLLNTLFNLEKLKIPVLA